MKRYLLFFLALLTSSIVSKAQSYSISGGAGGTTWNTTFGPAQTPGWTQPVHPIGMVDFQYKLVYVEFAGDPHGKDYNEASTASIGLRVNLLKIKRHTIFAQASIGGLVAPSWLDYCGSYEYEGGDCNAGGKPPEVCWWFSTNVGIGYRIRLTKHWAIEPAKFEYLNPFAIGPRYRFSSAFRYYF